MRKGTAPPGGASYPSRASTRKARRAAFDLTPDFALGKARACCRITLEVSAETPRRPARWRIVPALAEATLLRAHDPGDHDGLTDRRTRHEVVDVDAAEVEERNAPVAAGRSGSRCNSTAFMSGFAALSRAPRLCTRNLRPGLRFMARQADETACHPVIQRGDRSMRNLTCSLLASLLLAAPALADPPTGNAANERLDAKGKRIEERLDAKGDRKDARLDAKGQRIEERLDAKGDRKDARLDARAERALEHGNVRRAERLDAKGDRINARLDAKGARIEERLDAKGDRKDARLDAKGQRIEERLDAKGDRIDERLGGSAD
jgi:hypothetical protein